MDYFLKIADAINDEIDAIISKIQDKDDDYVDSNINGELLINWDKVKEDLHEVVEYNLTADGD